jgi:pyridoxamine 5'-phosphate oxidase
VILNDPLEELRSRIGLPSPLPADPFPLLAAWADDARNSKHTPNPDAMVLATATPDGAPSARVVLCKAIEVETGSIVFYTHYTSKKATDISANPRAACVFHWDHAGRQARASGVVERVSVQESDAYFRSRPLLSRLGAWASEQGRPLHRRTDLIERVRDVMRRFGVGPHHFVLPATAPDIPRPDSWGGYRMTADRVELWLGGGGRLHDRAVWVRSLNPAESVARSAWASTRIQP